MIENSLFIIKDIRVSSTRISREGGEAIAMAMVKCRNLVNVDLSDNSFGK